LFARAEDEIVVQLPGVRDTEAGHEPDLAQDRPSWSSRLVNDEAAVDLLR